MGVTFSLAHSSSSLSRSNICTKLLILDFHLPNLVTVSSVLLDFYVKFSWRFKIILDEV